MVLLTEPSLEFQPQRSTKEILVVDFLANHHVNQEEENYDFANKEIIFIKVDSQNRV